MNQQTKSIKKVVILGLYKSMASTIFGPMDILNQAGRLWNRVKQSPQEPIFDVAIASADGNAIECLNKVRIAPHCSIEEIDRADLIVVASATYIDEIVQQHPGLVGWLRKQYENGAHVASICTGVFLLAETGLLDKKSATLHWGFTERFRQRYPQVALEPDRMFIDHGRLYCSAGVNAGMDLSLYLVEKFCGKRHAVESAKTMILDLGRKTQAPYASVLFSQSHGDPVIGKTQEWMETHYAKAVDYEQLAQKFRISRRSMERRFKQATGLTPLAYLQQVRVETAKRLLEEGRFTFNEITYRVGYEDIPFFRKLFIRLTGLRPREYQQRFSGYTAMSGLK